MLEGAERFNDWVHRFGFGAPTGVELPGEEAGRRAGARPLLGLLDGQPADRPGRARHAAADGERLCGDRQRRHPAPAATSIASVAGRPQPAPAGRRVISATTAAALRADAEGRARARRHRQRGVDPRLSARGQDRHREQGRPAPPASTPRAPTSPRSSASLRPPIPKLLCAVIVDEPQSGSIYGGTVAAPAFGQIMSFALPYLHIPPG